MPGVRLLIVVLLVILALPATSSAATSDPCSKKAAADEGFSLLARNGALRVVGPAGTYTVYACTPRYPKGLLLAKGDFDEPCGSNSSRTVGVPGRGGAAIVPRFALVAVNVVNDNCEDDDGYQVLRVDLGTRRRTVVAAGKGGYASDVVINDVGTAAWTIDFEQVRFAARGKKPQLLLARGAGSWRTPAAKRIGPGATPVLTVEQGTETTKLDVAKHLRARRRCRTATTVITSFFAASAQRLCILATGKSVARAGCRESRGPLVLCGTRVIDVARNKVVREHRGLAGRREKVGRTTYNLPLVDFAVAPGDRTVILRSGTEVVTNGDGGSVESGLREIVVLLPGGKEKVLARTEEQDWVQLRLTGSTVRWVVDRFDEKPLSRSVRLPAA